MQYKLVLLFVFLIPTFASARSPWTTSRISGSPTAPLPYKIKLAYPQLKFKNPKCVSQIPGTNRLLVAHDGGQLVSFAKEDEHVDSTSLVANLKEIEGVHVGANTVAFHPKFASNRYIFVAMGHDEGGWHSRVMRYTLSDEDDPKVMPDSGKFIIRWAAGGHGGGCLDFGTDGFLYISTGDAAGPTPPDPRNTGQDISDLLGAVLRIDVDTDEAYLVPKDNPFVDLEDARPEIWSYGLRNPWKFGIDRKTGDVFVADNGWETWEVIHKLHRGSNCGWPIMEGRARLRTEVKQGPTPITPPVKDHPHTEANSVIGGPVYRGDRFADLHGTFVYGDYITGTLWGLKSGSGDSFEHRTLADSDLHIVAFTETSDGEILVLDFDTTQQLYKVVPNKTPDTSESFPRRLSDTGLFRNLKTLEPAVGVEPYQITAEPWMDGAIARRFIALPGRTAIELEHGVYPEGTVLVKHLAMPRAGRDAMPLETQLLHFERGEWHPYTYLWNESGDDATLVSAEGENREIPSAIDPEARQTWRAGSTNECRLCHNAGSDVVLGFTARQLDREKQLDLLVGKGVLATVPGWSGNRLVDPHDEAAELDDRGRSYLHMNCGICHNRQGPVTISFFAHRDYDFKDLRITKGPGVGNFGIEEARLVKPGLPHKSIILYRLGKLGYGRMPYIGSRVVDSRGIGLIESWIASLAEVDAKPTSTDDVESALKTTEGAIAIMAKLHRGELSEAQQKQVRLVSQKSNSDIRGLFEHFIPESERKQTLGSRPDPATVLAIDGDTKRGELIFLSDNARCKSCHHVDDPAKSLGPPLSRIRETYVRRNELLDHVLHPSKKIDDKFAAWTIILANGRVETGVIVKQDAKQVTIQTADRKIRRLDRDDIEEMIKSDRSLMPEGLFADLTPQEAADLLKYLGAKSN